MQPEWRDAVATVPVLLTIALYVDYFPDGTALWVHGARAMAATALVLGLVAFLLGAGRWTGPARWVSAPLGTAALLCAVFTLVTGDGLTLALLVGLIAALWLVSTVRHLRTPAGRP
ncbi:hypothetical protein QRX60_41445 [Amycolatopsis mongoliensis]|uniref:Uncharacterized protein n=1 Tax=Amycolatopsis mongoliensis TaxID=715475 RepID=A0A9Y2K0I2_9PSEU|nr:hypothetical protein [Amycolatopsis sp. 4-36]WIY07583.1 hypothetical protein QRX60_41445 [Amycolatopsis sp. 4-36]